MSKSNSNYVGFKGFHADPVNQPLNSAISQPVTVGVDVAYPAVIAARDISYVIECIRTGIVESRDIRPLILTIRNLPNHDLAKAMKAKLPYFLGSYCVGRRANANVKSARFIIFDLDHVEDPELVKRVAMDKLPFLRYAFRSVRDGVKLIAELGSPVTNENVYRQIWKYLAFQVERALGMEVDATPDWCRACFFSFDPGLLTNARCQPADVRVAAASARLLNFPDRPKNSLPSLSGSPATVDDMVSNPASTHHDSCDPCNSWTESDFSRAEALVRRLALIPVSYRDWVRVGMALYAGFGERGKALWDIFLSNPHYRDTREVIDRHWRSFASVRAITLSTLFYVGEQYGCA